MTPLGRRRTLIFASAGTALVITVALLSTRPGGDTESIEQNRFLAGSIDLATTPAAAVVGYTDMLPGDDVIRPIKVENRGSGDLRYSLSGTASRGGLSKALLIEIRAAQDGDCLPFDGTPLVGPVPVSSFGFGAATAGADPGDRVLAAGEQETLCIGVRLPLEAENDFQGTKAELTFTFDAEQVKNNP